MNTGRAKRLSKDNYFVMVCLSLFADTGVMQVVNKMQITILEILLSISIPSGQNLIISDRLMVLVPQSVATAL